MTTSRLLQIVLLVLFLSSASLLQSESALAVPPNTCTEVPIYSENHDDGSDWTSPTDYDGLSDYELPWEHSTGVSYSGSYRWYMYNYGVTTEARLVSPSITIPAAATGELFLRFYHMYNTENGNDGGIVEISVNDGAYEYVEKTDFTQNGYPRLFNGAGTVLGYLEAFTGTSAGFPAYIESIVDLSSYAGAEDTLSIRFRFASNERSSAGAGGGWYVDDVQVGYCASSNTPPTATDVSQTILEDTPFNSSISASDPDSDPLIFSLDTAPAHGSASIQPGGAFIYTPNADYNGTDSFTVLVSDGKGGTATATVSVTINPVNDPPSFMLSVDPPAVNEDSGAQTVTAFASSISAGPADEAVQTLAFHVNVTATTGNLTFSTAPALTAAGTLNYTAASNAYGTATVQVTLSDSGGTADGGSDTSAPQTFTITVMPVNDPPVADDLLMSTPEDTPLNGSLTANDLDGDSLTFALDGVPANGQAVVQPDGTFTYTPDADFYGTDSFTFMVSDGSSSDTGTVTIEVGSINDMPAVTADADFTADLNVPVTVSATYTDADSGDSHTVTINWGDGSAIESVPAVGGTVSGSHTYTSSGNFTVLITVLDSSGGTGSASLIISVNAPTYTPTHTHTATITASPTDAPTLEHTPTPTPTSTAAISPTRTSSAPPPPPAPLAVDVNATPESIVRSGIPDRLYSDIHIREIVVNGAYPLWLGAPSTHAGYIGNEGVLAMGVQQAVDIFSPTGLTYFEGGIVVCLRGEGTLIYLNANRAPRIAEIVGSYEVPEFPGFTCVTLFEPGALVLVDAIE